MNKILFFVLFLYSYSFAEEYKITTDDGYITIVFKTDGKIEGNETTYYPNGQILQKTHFIKGVEDGPSYMFYENGRLKVYYLYKMGELINISAWDSTGKSEVAFGYGVLKFFTPEGIKVSEISFKNCKRNGLSISYHENGNKAFEEYYEDDKLVGNRKDWDINGNLKK